MKPRIVYLVFLSFYVFIASTSLNAQESLRLTEEDLKDNLFKLEGKWEYYDHQFLMPGELSNTPPLMVYSHTFLSKQGISNFSFGTLKKTYYLDTDEPLGIEMPLIYSAYNLYINGKKIASNGTVGINKETAVPFRFKLNTAIPQAKDSLEIFIHLSNFRHFNFGFSEPIKVGRYQKIKKMSFLRISYDIFITGSLIMGGFFFLGLYYFGEKQKVGLYFAVFSILYGYRVISSDNFILHQFFPDYPWEIAIRFEYVSLYFLGVSFVLYFRQLFKDAMNDIIIKLYLYICYGFILTSLLPADWFTQWISYHLVLSLIMLLYLFSLIVKYVLSKKSNSRTFMLSMILIFGVLLYFTLKYFSILDSSFSFIVQLMQPMFFFFQGLIISRIFASSWKNAKEIAENSLKTKSEFLSVMSHEIRTPLNAIVGITNHLIEDDPKPSHISDLNNLKTSSNNLLSLVNNILDFSKMEAGKLTLKLETVVLKKFILGITNPFLQLSRNKGIELYVNFNDKIPIYLELDKGRFIQIVTNLVGNAVKFTDKGEVIVNVNLLNTYNDKILLRFEVKDTGIGIKKAMQQKIFHAFEQVNRSVSRKYEGTGLGLSITKNLLELMGSELKVTSVPGKGSTFYFDLQLRSTKPLAISSNQIDKDLLKGKQVLLVEDNELNILIAKRLLIKWGVEVTTAKNGIDAINNYSKEKFDLILMDLQMPLMDGYEASKQLKKLGCKEPIIALSASAQFDLGEKLKDAGIDALVSKPFDPNILFNEMSSRLKLN